MTLYSSLLFSKRISWFSLLLLITECHCSLLLLVTECHSFHVLLVVTEFHFFHGLILATISKLGHQNRWKLWKPYCMIIFSLVQLDYKISIFGNSGFNNGLGQKIKQFIVPLAWAGSHRGIKPPSSIPLSVFFCVSLLGQMCSLELPCALEQ